MANITNNFNTSHWKGEVSGLVVGSVVGIVIIVLLVLYGLPSLHNTYRNKTNVGVTTPVSTAPAQSIR